MPIAPPEGRPRRLPYHPGRCPRSGPARWVVLVLGVLLVGAPALTGCAWLRAVPAAEPTAIAPPQVRAEVAGLLATRTRAVRQGRTRAFTRTVAPGPLRASQRTWFRTVQALPLREFSQRLVGEVHVVDGGYRASVRTLTQLSGFDLRPVPTLNDVVLRPGQHGWQISTLEASRSAAPSVRQPWDTAALTVTRVPGFLVLTDAGATSTEQRAALVADLTAARAAVARTVPEGDLRPVVVRAPSTTGPLVQVANLPGGEGERLDAIAHRAVDRRGRPAGSRLLLHPRMLTLTGDRRSRVLRHELTHVALAQHHLPTWLGEGVAEYVATRDLPVQERTIARGALDEARSGTVRIPTDTEFAATASGTQYGVSWFACEAIVQRGGQGALWRVVDRLDGHAGQPDAVDAVLRDEVGVDLAGLESATAEAMVRAYA